MIFTCKKINSPNKYPLPINWTIGAFKAVLQSKKEDTLVCWYDFQAVLCFWISRFLGKKRKIIAINLLLKDKDTLRNKCVAYLYKKALTSNHFIASVTSRAYGDSLNDRFKTHLPFFLLKDVFSSALYQETDFCDGGNSVFCGGKNGRDWMTVIETAKQMPDVAFHLVMPEFIHKVYCSQQHSNIKIYSNISRDEFNRLLRSSSIVMLPVNTSAPAGLIVMFTAAANHKLVITTSTPVTNEYINESNGVLVEKNQVSKYVEEIYYYLNHKDEMRSKGEKLFNDIQQTCSEGKYIENILQMTRYFQ